MQKSATGSLERSTSGDILPPLGRVDLSIQNTPTRARTLRAESKRFTQGRYQLSDIMYATRSRTSDRPISIPGIGL